MFDGTGGRLAVQYTGYGIQETNSSLILVGLCLYVINTQHLPDALSDKKKSILYQSNKTDFCIMEN